MLTLYELNGWNTENMAKFAYADIEDISVDELSQAVQRIFATSAVEMDRPVMNMIREKILGVAPLADDEEVDKEKLPAAMSGQTTSSGDGMAVGTTGTGTAKKPVKQDSASANKSK